ncbi:unknown protein [Desulfotalea psychrophila LSv54]|uniref:Uncharacterized protein n=1 Tax=Desulfotalea psychrophila (strain LSv54 / DSM 12343) TaxID=177439 RepID=Q6AQJ2_DESPS|nr:unknown protein [Desulfotalea psychrophila LSv54]
MKMIRNTFSAKQRNRIFTISIISTLLNSEIRMSSILTMFSLACFLNLAFSRIKQKNLLITYSAMGKNCKKQCASIRKMLKKKANCYQQFAFSNHFNNYYSGLSFRPKRSCTACEQSLPS